MRSELKEYHEAIDRHVAELAAATGTPPELLGLEEDYDSLMQESAVSDNHGRRLSRISPEDGEIAFEDRPSRSLDSRQHEALSHLHDGGSVVFSGDETYHGLVAHRGVLSEYDFSLLDWDRVASLIADQLDSTVAEINEVYGPGRPDPQRVARRAELDERLLEVQEAGGNMHQLASMLEWAIETTPTGHRCRKMTSALQRARIAREAE